MIDLCSELDDAQALLPGGKGLGLFRLFKVGAVIPRVICLPESMGLESAAYQVLSYFGDSGGDREYAVRSSASIEDGKVKSSAGQSDNSAGPDGQAYGGTI